MLKYLPYISCLIGYPPCSSPFPISVSSGLTIAPSFANLTTNLPFGSNSTSLILSGLSDTVRYLIPGSTITLAMNLRPSNPIKPDDLSLCLYSTSTRVLHHLQRYGDGLLDAIDDPLTSDPIPGMNCTFGIRSWRQHTPQARISFLTYSIVHTTLRGLLEYMLFPDAHYYSNSFTVWNGKQIVGLGSVNTLLP